MDKKQINKLIIAIISLVAFTVTVGLSYKTYLPVLQIIMLSVLGLYLLLFLLGVFLKKERLYKLTIILIYFSIIFLAVATAIIKSGVLEKIDSVEELVAVINSYGVAGKLVFVLVQFLQVTFIPIPSTIVTAAGAALYSTWESLLLSCIGLWAGSLFAFFLGRTFGVKLVKWVVGDEMLLKYTSLVKGRDKAMLVYMFIFPMFPDDVLCMIAGLTTMSYPTFIAVQLISRPLNVAGTIFLVDYVTAIPFTGWGIALWVVIAILFIGVFVLMWKYAERIETGMLKFISKVRGKPIIKDVNAIYRIKTAPAVVDVPQEKSSEELFEEYNEKLQIIAKSREKELAKAEIDSQEIIIKKDKDINF